VYVKRDFVITNAALGEELVDNSGRSVVKVTHQPINPDYFSDDSDYDSEDMSDDDIPSDLDELAEEDEEEAPAAKGGKKAAAADKIEVDEDDEEEDDEDYDSEDDTPHVEAVMCALTAGKIEQATINLTFVEGEIVVFEATGKK
jgi:FK506-binding nuclear protein